MSKEFQCEACRKYLGEMGKGKVRLGSVMICRECWPKVEAAMAVALMASKDTPQVVKDMLDGFMRFDDYKKSGL